MLHCGQLRHSKLKSIFPAQNAFYRPVFDRPYILFLSKAVVLRRRETKNGAEKLEFFSVSGMYSTLVFSTSPNELLFV